MLHSEIENPWLFDLDNALERYWGVDDPITPEEIEIYMDCGGSCRSCDEKERCKEAKNMAKGDDDENI